MGIRAITAAVETFVDGHAAGVEVAKMVLAHGPLARRSVAILLLTIEADVEAVAAGVRKTLGVPLIGCTTYSEATGAGYTEESVTLLVLTSDTAEFGIGLGERLSTEGADAVGKGWDEAVGMLSKPPRLVIAFPDGALSGRGELVVDALRAKTANRIPIVGACPGDGGAFKRTLQIFDDKVLSDAVPLLLVAGDDVVPAVVTRTGWEPIGAIGVATKASGAVLEEVDGAPALDFVARYVSEIDDPEILGTFPIALCDDDGTHYVVRSPFFADRAKGTVTYAAPIPVGAKIRMGRAYREQVVASASDAARAILGARGGTPPSCVFFASCGARKLVLGAAVDREVDALKKVFGDDVPIAGFYSYGEIGPLDEPANGGTIDTRYHNCTLVLCAL